MDTFKSTTNHEGYAFSDFHARKDPHYGPGWYVFGRNAEKYGRNADGKGSYVMLCARPDTPLRRSKGFNRPVPPGWRTKREAQAVAAAMNAEQETTAA